MVAKKQQIQLLGYAISAKRYALFERVGDALGTAGTLNGLGRVRSLIGDMAGAVAAHRRARTGDDKARGRTYWQSHGRTEPGAFRGRAVGCVYAHGAGAETGRASRVHLSPQQAGGLPGCGDGDS